MNKIRKAIITAAGFGSRFLPITKTIPKEMLPVIDKPIIHYIVKECAEAGIEEVIIVAAPDEVKIFEDYFYGHGENIRMLMQLQGKMDRWEKVKEIFTLPKVTIIPENRTIPYGNGRPLLSAKSLLEGEEAFVVAFGDDLVLSDRSAIAQLVDYFVAHPSDGLLGVQEMPREEVVKYGVIKLADQSSDRVELVVEKPSIEEAPSNLASYGRFILTQKVFAYLTPDQTGKDGEVWLQDANAQIAKEGDLRALTIDGTWYTTGDPANYLQAQLAYARRAGLV